MEPEPPGAAFFAWSRSRPNLVGAGVGSGTSDFRSRPKNVAAPEHWPLGQGTSGSHTGVPPGQGTSGSHTGVPLGQGTSGSHTGEPLGQGTSGSLQGCH